MKISQKRTCNGCKAQGVHNWPCELDFSTEPVYKNGTVFVYKPSEPCPKPLTNDDYLEAWLEVDRKRNSQPEEK